MTYEEALQSVLMYCSEECGKIDTCRGEYKECAEATVIKALEKQIPKKPIEKFAFSDDIEAGLCPLCNEGVNEEMNFCSYCGQAIDWEVSE